MANSNVITINLFADNAWVSKEVTATTVGQLRVELEISSDASVMVGSTQRTDQHVLQDGDNVAYALNNKTGGSPDFSDYKKALKQKEIEFVIKMHQSRGYVTVG